MRDIATCRVYSRKPEFRNWLSKTSGNWETFVDVSTSSAFNAAEQRLGTNPVADSLVDRCQEWSELAVAGLHGDEFSASTRTNRIIIDMAIWLGLQQITSLRIDDSLTIPSVRTAFGGGDV